MPPAPINISCDPIEITFGNFYFRLFRYPANPRDPSLDRTFRPQPIDISLDLIGEMFNICFSVSPIDISLNLIGRIVEGISISDDNVIGISIVPTFTYFNLSHPRINFIRWSRIGSFNFDEDHSNVAGNRPLDWYGWVYSIRKCNGKIIAYGENGVTVLKPVDIKYGIETVYKIGLKGRLAVSGDESVNFFIDKYGRLCKIDDKITILDYSEYLSQLDNPVLSYDKVNKLLYICDGVLGFVYGVDSKSLGQGPVNVTGIDYLGNTPYIVATEEIVIPKLMLTTNILDFSTRKPKTINKIDIGTNFSEGLFTSIEYRDSGKENFKQIKWFKVNNNGRSFPMCYGVEFKIKVKSLVYESIKLDYMKIGGFIHGYSPLDTDYNVSNTLSGLFKSR